MTENVGSATLKKIRNFITLQIILSISLDSVLDLELLVDTTSPKNCIGPDLDIQYWHPGHSPTIADTKDVCTYDGTSVVDPDLHGSPLNISWLDLDPGGQK